MSSNSESPEPTYPPDCFDGWFGRPMPLDVSRHGERAKFLDNSRGSPTVVERKEYDVYEDGCIVYTNDRIPVDTAWCITVLGTTDRWQRGLVSG